MKLYIIIILFLLYGCIETEYNNLSGKCKKENEAFKKCESSVILLFCYNKTPNTQNNSCNIDGLSVLIPTFCRQKSNDC